MEFNCNEHIQSLYKNKKTSQEINALSSLTILFNLKQRRLVVNVLFIVSLTQQ